MNNIRLQIYDFLFIQTTIWVFLTLKIIFKVNITKKYGDTEYCLPVPYLRFFMPQTAFT